MIAQLRHEPAVLALSRQKLPTLDRNQYASAEGLAKGAYVLADTETAQPDVLLLATGSEVALAIKTFDLLEFDGIRTRVVSMPSWKLLERQDRAYREQVLPPDVSTRISIEQSSTFGWAQYVGPTGVSFGMTSFGASAPLKSLQEHFGFTTKTIVEAAKKQLVAAV